MVSSWYRSSLVALWSILSSLYCLGVCDTFGFSPSIYGNIELRREGGSDQNPIGLYYYAAAKFGPSLPDQDHAFKGVVHIAHPHDGCGQVEKPPVVSLPKGTHWVALMVRSGGELFKTKSCTFIDKVLNAQLAGYSGVIIYNYDASDPDPMEMGASNVSEMNRVNIPSVFINYNDGMDLALYSYPDRRPNISVAFFLPEFDPIDPFKVLVPLAFSFVGILLITCVVMMVRWCQAIQRKRRSRVTKSQLRKIPLKSYSRGDQYDCCAICLDDYEEGEKLRVLPCEHTYHQKCIDPWLLKNKRTCPVCKRKVISSRRSSRSRRAANATASATPAAQLDSTDSEDAGPSTERTPLLPPPVGPSSQALLHTASTSRTNNYGSASTGAVNITVSDTSSDDDDDDLTSYGASFATMSSLSYSTPMEGWRMRSRIPPANVQQVHLPTEQPPATAATSSNTCTRDTVETESSENRQAGGAEGTSETAAVPLPPSSGNRPPSSGNVPPSGGNKPPSGGNKPPSGGNVIV